jgi:hypothetical protein
MARSKELKQLSLIDDKLETPVVKSADRYIQLVKDASVIKEKKQVQERNLIGLLKKAGKEKILHGGFLIKVATPNAKAKIVMKESTNSKR